ncbi:30S ribosomal protein S18 [Candidatus Hodgkinia cicadicola]|uniref:30S ribosomal protein S18 n=1 Tax=Candidatus Hodgkinia cicadicola TaxID=573658 RepID=A0ABX4MK18_9HYPH|nr:30S ribosomal protein S18 [Candidatus Hodgkinia cicadicola]
MHFIINARSRLTTCVLKRIKQSIRVGNIAMRWHLFSRSRKDDNNKPMVCINSKLLKDRTLIDGREGLEEMDKNMSRCSGLVGDVSSLRLGGFWLSCLIGRYKDMTYIQNYITESGKIMARKTTRLNKKDHKDICREIKRYRNLGLISKTNPLIEIEKDINN